MTLLEKLLSQLKNTNTEKVLLNGGLDAFRTYMQNRTGSGDDREEYTKTYFRNLGIAAKDEDGYEVSLHNHYIALSRSQGWWVEMENGDVSVKGT